MRAEGPIEWMVQALVIGPDEYIAIHVGPNRTPAEIEEIGERLRVAWPGARIAIFSGDIRIATIEGACHD